MTRIAELTVDSPQKMTRMGRHQVATWLEKSARTLQKEQPEIYARNARWSYFAGSRKRRIATLRLNGAPLLANKNKERIARWMLSRAQYLRKHGDLVGRRWFTQVLSDVQPRGQEVPEPMRVALP